MGAASTRPSLRPLLFEGMTIASLGRVAPRDCGGMSGYLMRGVDDEWERWSGESPGVIAREGWRSSIREPPAIETIASAYWMPRLRGA